MDDEKSPEEEQLPEEGQLSDTEWEYEQNLTGPLLLQELPRDKLANMVAFALKEGASPIQLQEAVEWLRKRQDWHGEIVYQNDHGFLTREPYVLSDDDDDFTYEWVEAPTLLVIEQGSLQQWGHAMIANYGWRIVAGWNM